MKLKIYTKRGKPLSILSTDSTRIEEMIFFLQNSLYLSGKRELKKEKKVFDKFITKSRIAFTKLKSEI